MKHVDVVKVAERFSAVKVAMAWKRKHDEVSGRFAQLLHLFTSTAQVQTHPRARGNGGGHAIFFIDKGQT